ncbi:MULTISPECIES: hypothetical protein [Sporosarcina]|uniref:hypothetical protein n=1 Tax=Sporosarcina TaxID=1569 RepID=UPI00129C0AA1|nr:MULTISPECIES: hypothetical protein [Sporosarcina]GKV66546.1 hypothetical protein NCCP2331_26990 [Sporosarcina sp. NCCP-2331]GLB56823.1 hypothetical protein NCCP2378_26100 [Sporosarcina sp. NCCP-2378]
MTAHEWTVSETFYFPAEYGAFSEAAELKVTPGYTEERTEEAIRLQGIYHIAANVVFDSDKLIEDSAEDRLIIDDVEVENGNGYFEYAVPLNVDLPSETVSTVDLKIADVQSSPLEDGGLYVEWKVQLQSESVVKEEAVAAVQEVAVAVESTSHLEFLANADQAVEQGQKEMEDFLLYIAELDDDVTRKIFHSNNVFVEAERETGEEAKQ